MSVQRVVVFGATSAIAMEVARCLVDAGAALCLVARDLEKVETLAADLRARGASRVEVLELDALAFDRHDEVIAAAEERLGGLDVVLLAYGTLPDQQACEQSFDVARHELDINFLSVLSLLTRLANRFEQQGRGTLAVLSSVAGDRGRQSNYIYGAAKGGIAIVLQGLRNRLSGSKVRVVTIKLGRVDTPMTVDFEKGISWARPAAVAPAICRAIARGSDVVYVPGYWRIIMLVLRAIPEAWFKRLRL